jgi:hypothetical protein
MAKKAQPDVEPQLLMLAYLCIKDAGSLEDKVMILDRFSLGDSAIGRVSGATVGSVRNARLSRKQKPGIRGRKTGTQVEKGSSS